MATQKWTVEEAWKWQNEHKWLRGCNFLPSDCCNRIAFWQSLDWEKHLETADRELALAASIGFNSIRVILEFTVLDEEQSFSQSLINTAFPSWSVSETTALFPKMQNTALLTSECRSMTGVITADVKTLRTAATPGK